VNNVPAPSNNPPDVKITEPENGSIVNGSIIIKGKAWDIDGNETLQKVEIRIDDGSWQEATGTTSWTYNLDTTSMATGNYDIYARSYDGTNYSDINYVTITISNPTNQPPTVKITSPNNGKTVVGVITILGTASDEDGSIANVEIRIDNGDWEDATGTNSWSYDWDTETVNDGEHTIKARSWDGKDYSSITTITVTVDNEEDKGGGGIPGFELIIAIGVIMFITIWKSNKRKI